MMGEINKAIMKAEKELENMIEIDSRMIQAYASITMKNSEEKKEILDKYIELYNKRVDIDKEINDIAIYLERVASDLSKHMLNRYDRKRHKINVKVMKDMIKNEIKFMPNVRTNQEDKEML